MAPSNNVLASTKHRCFSADLLDILTEATKRSQSTRIPTGSWVSGATDTVSSAAEAAANATGSWVNGAVDTVSSAAGSALDSAGSALNSAGSAISSAAGEAASAVGDGSGSSSASVVTVSMTGVLAAYASR
ncbi:hypothetical protein GQ600_14201 [Phytophthora cactorum]|nr:hypothetical protein GQ600_14201 [Phytophthora cactorum]